MHLLSRFASRFTTAALTYFLADIDQHLVPPFVLTCSSDSPRYMSGGSDLYPFILNEYLIPSIFSWGRSWLLLHCQHKPEHIFSIPFRLIWSLVSSKHPDLICMGCNWCRAGDSPTWLWTLPLMISGHRDPFLRPWRYPTLNRIWVLPWSIWALCTSLLGKYLYVTHQYFQSIQCCNCQCNSDWVPWDYIQVRDWCWFSSGVSASQYPCFSAEFSPSSMSNTTWHLIYW